MTEHLDTARTVADAAGVGILVGVLMSWLPAIAAVLTVLWTLVRIYNEVMVAVDRHKARKVHRVTREIDP